MGNAEVRGLVARGGRGNGDRRRGRATAAAAAAAAADAAAAAAAKRWRREWRGICGWRCEAAGGRRRWVQWQKAEGACRWSG